MLKDNSERHHSVPLCCTDRKEPHPNPTYNSIPNSTSKPNPDTLSD